MFLDAYFSETKAKQRKFQQVALNYINHGSFFMELLSFWESAPMRVHGWFIEIENEEIDGIWQELYTSLENDNFVEAKKQWDLLKEAFIEDQKKEEEEKEAKIQAEKDAADMEITRRNSYKW